MQTPCLLFLIILLVILLLLLVLLVFQSIKKRLTNWQLPSFCKIALKIKAVLWTILIAIIGLLYFVPISEVSVKTYKGMDCPTILLLLLVFLLVLVSLFVIKVVACGMLDVLEKWKQSVVVVFILATLSLLIQIGMCCNYNAALWLDTKYGVLLVIAFVVIVFIILVTCLERLTCSHRKPANCVPIQASLAILIAACFTALITIINVCHDKWCDSKPELAMAGIFWEGNYAGESGIHLRWSFKNELPSPLPFPQEGFNLYRKPSTGSDEWQLLNTEGKIFPVEFWSGTSSAPVWKPAAQDRLPSAIHYKYEAPNTENIDYLLSMLGRPPFDTLYYVETQDDPFSTRAAADTYVNGQNILYPDMESLFQWQIVPMSLFDLMSVHPEIARMLGLYFIDTNVDATQTFDYKIVGYWTDRERSYVLEDIGKETTTDLEPTELISVKAIASPTMLLPDGTFWPTEARVGLRWKDPRPNPNQSFSAADGIQPVLYLTERQKLSGPVGMEFQPIKDFNDAGTVVDRDPISVQQQEDAVGIVSWPEYFLFDNWVEYDKYAYRVKSIDFFGRVSPPSNSVEIDVKDEVPPPPPDSVRATLFQRADVKTYTNLVESLKSKLFPSSTNQLALRISWRWAAELQARVPDVKEFKIYYTTTSTSNEPPELDHEFWSPDVLHSKAVAAFTTNTGGDFGYEVILDDLPAEFISAFTTNDDVSIKYGHISVLAIDHDPSNNPGLLGTPASIFTRDFIPPDPPLAPVKEHQSIETNSQGNINLTIRLNGIDSRYEYQIFRIREKDLGPITGFGDSEFYSACIQETTDDMKTLQKRALNKPELFTLVTPIPIRGANAGATHIDFSDEVDGTLSQRFIYAAKAIDPAGNKSRISCPSMVLPIEDAFAPTVPKISKIEGEDGKIRLQWVQNSEGDLEIYEVYRTTRQQDLNSKRKLELISKFDELGTVEPAFSSLGSASESNVRGDKYLNWSDPAVVPGEDYFYRIVAIDGSGNTSAMSDFASGRAYDLTPPTKPAWAAANALSWTTQTDGTNAASLSWLLSEGNLQVKIQRKKSGSAAWITITTIHDISVFIDNEARSTNDYEYRIQTIDKAGNKSDWSEIKTLSAS